MSIFSRIGECIRGGIIMLLGWAAMKSDLFVQAISRAGTSLASCTACQDAFKYIPFRDQMTSATVVMIVGVVIMLAGFGVFADAVIGKKYQPQPQEVVIKVEK